MVEKRGKIKLYKSKKSHKTWTCKSVSRVSPELYMSNPTKGCISPQNESFPLDNISK